MPRQTPGLQNENVQVGRESKMATDTKESKRNKTIMFSRMARYIQLIFRMEFKWDLGVQYQREKKKICSVIMSQWPFEMQAGRESKMAADT